MGKNEVPKHQSVHWWGVFSRSHFFSPAPSLIPLTLTISIQLLILSECWIAVYLSTHKNGEERKKIAGLHQKKTEKESVFESYFLKGSITCIIPYSKMKEMKLFQLKSATKGFSTWHFQPPKTLQSCWCQSNMLFKTRSDCYKQHLNMTGLSVLSLAEYDVRRMVSVPSWTGAS
jgi:hypothetical protein